MKDTLISAFVGTASGTPAYIAGAPWWVLLVAVFAPRLLLLVSQRMDYREVHRLASLNNCGTVRGRGGIQWRASTEPAQPEPEEPQAPKPKPWRRRKPPPDSS